MKPNGVLKVHTRCRVFQLRFNSKHFFKKQPTLPKARPYLTTYIGWNFIQTLVYGLTLWLQMKNTLSDKNSTDKIFDGLNFSTDIIFDTYAKVGHLCPSNFCPIRYNEIQTQLTEQPLRRRSSSSILSFIRLKTCKNWYAFRWKLNY